MNLSQLKYIVALAETRHFGHAAERCFVSQPTLSTQIRKLEESLGLVLFERTNKSVVVTEQGRRVLEHARLALAEIDAMKQLGEGARMPLSGTLRVGIIPTLCPYLLPWLLPVLRRRFESLDFQVVEDLTASITLMLAEHQVDCAILAVPEDMPASVEIPLFDEPFWVACPARHPLARAKSVALADLSDETLLYVSEGHCLRDQTLAVCGEEGRRKANRAEAFRGASLETLRRMVAAGMGFTLLPVLAMQGGAKDPDVVCRPFRGPASRRIGLLFRESYPRPEDMSLLAEAVVSALPASVSPVPSSVANI